MKKIICKNCKRILPNKGFITINGCIWCDAKYHDKKNVKNTKDSSKT